MVPFGSSLCTNAWPLLAVDFPSVATISTGALIVTSCDLFLFYCYVPMARPIL